MMKKLDISQQICFNFINNVQFLSVIWGNDWNSKFFVNVSSFMPRRISASNQIFFFFFGGSNSSPMKIYQQMGNKIVMRKMKNKEQKMKKKKKHEERVGAHEWDHITLAVFF